MKVERFSILGEICAGFIKPGQFSVSINLRRDIQPKTEPPARGGESFGNRLGGGLALALHLLLQLHMLVVGG